MISVIVPIYNTEKYLDKCLSSIKNQTYVDFEVIMVDDGSSDNSAKIAKKFEDSDNRFHLFLQANEGVSAARNRGLSIAMGGYILFMDSDDWIEAEMLETLMHNIEQSEVDISCCQYDHNINNGIEAFEIWSKEEALERFLIHKKLNGSLVNKLIKRSLIGDIKLDTNIKYGEDALFLWKLLLNINRLVITNKVLYHVTLHEDSASGGGSYKPIRSDCIPVWEEISSDADKIGKELRKLARSQLANMAFFSLYEMVYYGYEDRIQSQLYLQVLKYNYFYLKMDTNISLAEKILSWIFLHNMFIGKKIVQIKLKYYINKEKNH